MTETDVESTVRTLLSVAGLSPSEDEIAILVQAYPGHKAGIESLYTIPEVKYGRARARVQRQPDVRRLVELMAELPVTVTDAAGACRGRATCRASSCIAGCSPAPTRSTRSSAPT